MLKRSAALPDDMAMVTHVMAYPMVMTLHHRTIAAVVSGGNGCYSAQSAHCKSDGKENFFHRIPWKIDVRCERFQTCDDRYCIDSLSLFSFRLAKILNPPDSQCSIFINFLQIP
jgi:hypothetical protein